MQNNKYTFLYGSGLRKEYSNLFRYFNLPTINWNTWTTKPEIKEKEVLIGFSLGGLLAGAYCLKHKVKKLILCSLTPGAESLKKIKADEIIFIVGEKEKWVLEDIQRLVKTKTTQKIRIMIVPKTGHIINKRYLDILLSII